MGRKSSVPPLEVLPARVAREEIIAFRQIARERGIKPSHLVRLIVKETIVRYRLEQNREKAGQ
jgi:hypothetical protein